jgi:CheY-like chemotaxis protein
MPGMSGDEVARRLRIQAGGRAVLFIAVTAQGDPASIQLMADAGVRLLLVKPVRPQDLVQMINDYWRALERPVGVQ